MSIQLEIKSSDHTAADLQLLAAALGNQEAIHQRIAGDSERWIKGPKVAGKISGSQHRTANRLGATPTGHLVDAYNRVGSSGSEQAASLWIPGASRLRAAFGSYTVRPTGGRKYLTIPITAEAYGQRAGEVADLSFIFVKRTNTALLVKRNADKTYKPYYLLAREASIPEDPNLIPFDELEEVAKLAVGDYIDDAIGNPTP